jgi:hypothetical protein
MLNSRHECTNAGTLVLLEHIVYGTMQDMHARFDLQDTRDRIQWQC